MTSRYEIQIVNSQTLLPIDEAEIRQVVAATLQAEQITSAELVIALVDDPAIHVVNREHLQHDYPTDVISFLYDQPLGPGSLDGELVVSVETAAREATTYGWQTSDELTLYLVHGLLHLCGYDDLTEPEQQVMRERERSVLKIWNLSPHYKD
ncbi:rRNA maturation RNase YbeY [Planctomicrobium sp. SH664]|uniref:rRNA maturation RNase YbeY n=1 Tax=Planctomicrobium sp. SH664 TaxID=3448125 RepID=UPI003F5B4ECA